MKILDIFPALKNKFLSFRKKIKIFQEKEVIMSCDCGNKEFYATFEYKGNCVIDEKGNWIKDIQVIEAEFSGPYKCVNCGRKYKELPQDLIFQS